MEQKITDFFDPEVQRAVRKDGCSVYKMKNSTGEGVITQYEILPGIVLFYNDFHMSDGQNQNKLPKPNMIEINHCREGRFECTFQNGDRLYLGAGDLSIHRLSQETAKTSFPLSHYHGISLTIDLELASQTIRRLEAITGNLDIDLEAISNRFCREGTCFVVRGKSVMEHIFSELYGAEPERIAHYLKVKVLELFMYLNDMEVSEHREEKRYFSKNQVETITNLHDFMTADLGHHYTIEELSVLFHIPTTTLKECFKGIYGSSIYSYMKSYRMQAASVLLRDSTKSITEIAMKMGYDNPSKFSEVYKKETGTLPSEFRKLLSK